MLSKHVGPVCLVIGLIAGWFGNHIFRTQHSEDNRQADDDRSKTLELLSGISENQKTIVALLTKANRNDVVPPDTRKDDLELRMKKTRKIMDEMEKKMREIDEFERKNGNKDLEQFR